MQFQLIPRPSFTGRLQDQMCKQKVTGRSGSDNQMTIGNRRFYKHLKSNLNYSNRHGVLVSCSMGNYKDLYVSSSDIRLSDARVLYCVAPAMGHHQESHQDSHFRVPAITNALEKMELTGGDGSYPGTGKINEVGNGCGEGATLNVPLPGGSGDTSMRSVFEEVIVPCAQRFKPDIILVSAGYDAHVLDPVAVLQFTTGTYYWLASNIKQLARQLCGGRCVFFLEGGYNLESLSHSVADSFRAFLGEPSLASQFDNPAILYEEPSAKVKEAILKVKSIHSL